MSDGRRRGSSGGHEVSKAEWSRLARSWLFVPRARPERFEKAVQADADAIIIDLEDAVREDAKDQARTDARWWLEAGGSAFVRVNPANSRWFDADLECVSHCAENGLCGVVLPKVGTAAQVASVADAVPEPAMIVPLTETGQGVLDVTRIAAVPRVARLCESLGEPTP